MRTTERKATIRDYISLHLSIIAAVLMWTAFVFARHLDAPVSGLFIAALVLLTLSALGHIAIIPTRISPLWAWLRWDERRTTSQVYEKAVLAYRALDAAPYDSERAELEDHIRHLRTVVCVLNGWDATTECDTGGLADRHILAWWGKHYPKDFRLRS